MWQLVCVDLKVFKKSYFTKLVDFAIWVSITVGVMGYLMTAFGLDPKFGAFTAATIAGVIGVMEVYPNVAGMVMDLEGERLISYPLTLPLPSWMVFLAHMIVISIKVMSIGIFVAPFGMLLVYNQFNYSLISVPKFLLIFVLAAMFFGAFTVFMVSRTRGMAYLGTVWTRIMFPLWFLGGFQFTWYALYNKVPAIAYLSLANPFFYITEGTRAAMLGQAGSLNYWFCVGMLVISTLACAWLGINRLCKKLDTV